MSLMKRCIAEFIGTFWLVFGGCGSAVLAAVFAGPNQVQLGIGFVGVSLAFGLTVLTMAYALGHVSGGHFNPAVSFGLWAAKRLPAGELLPYIAAQVLGAIAAAGTLFLIANGKDGGLSLEGANPLATNGFGAHSPGGYTLLACFLIEALLTFGFLIVILGATDRRAPQGLAPVAIGLALTLIHLISIPVTNTSVNPARSTGPAIITGLLGRTELFQQVWLFWLAPILGAIIAGYFYSAIFDEPSISEAEAYRESV